MKNGHYILLCVSLLANTALGNWATNAWPSYDWPRASMIHAMECYSGIVERLDVLGVSPDTVLSTNHPYLGNMGTNSWPPSRDGTNYWFRSTLFNSEAQYGKGPRNSLGVLKAVLLSDVLENYVDYTQTNSSGELEGYYSLPLYTETTLCIAAGLPTNFFAYTPWRCLNGSGPFTNDATRTWPYGWTNEYTVAGGTNFPSSWTNWYTTDYGWHGLHSAINACKWTYLDAIADGDGRFKIYTPLEFLGSCSAAYTGATNRWAVRPTSTNSVLYRVGLVFADGYAYWAERGYGKAGTYDVPVTNGLECSIDAYLKCTGNGESEYGITNKFWDIDGLGMPNGLWFYHESFAEAGTTNRGGDAEASTYPPGASLEDPFLTAGISCPVSGNTGATTNWGSGWHAPPYNKWAVWGGIRTVAAYVLKWDGTNGFRFQE